MFNNNNNIIIISHIFNTDILLTEAMERLYIDKKFREKLTSTHKDYLKNFSPEENIKKWDDLLKKI
jgi:hypothetical protein